MRCPAVRSASSRRECYSIAGWPACEYTASSRPTDAPMGQGSAQQLNRIDIWLQVDPVRVHCLQQAEAAAMRQGQHRDRFSCHHCTHSCMHFSLLSCRQGFAASMLSFTLAGRSHRYQSLSPRTCHAATASSSAMKHCGCPPAAAFRLLPRGSHSAACRAGAVGLALLNHRSWPCLLSCVTAAQLHDASAAQPVSTAACRAGALGSALLDGPHGPASEADSAAGHT